MRREDRHLTPDEARELLPLYTDGRLDPMTARSLEELLKTDESLRADLRMWRVIAQVSRSRSAVQSENHVDPESLVAFAEDSATLSPETRSHISEHLSTCSGCRADFQMIKASLASYTWSQTRIAAFPRWRFAAAAVILLAIVGTILIANKLRYEPDSASKRLAVTLPFIEQYRSTAGNAPDTTVVMLTMAVTELVLQVELPLPPAQIESWKSQLFTPEGTALAISGLPVIQRSEDGFGRVVIPLGVSEYFGEKGLYRLVVSVRTRQEVTEELEYAFKVVRR